MSGGETIDDKAAALRAAFDAGFAALPESAQTPGEPYLAIEVAGTGYAVALTEVAALTVDRPIAALPGTVESCAGVAAFDGEIVPVHSLAALLGHDSDGARPRWLLRAAGAPLALQFDRLDGYVRIARDQIAPMQAGTATSFVAATAAVSGASRPIVQLQAITAYLVQRTGPARAGRED